MDLFSEASARFPWGESQASSCGVSDFLAAPIGVERTPLQTNLIFTSNMLALHFARKKDFFSGLISETAEPLQAVSRPRLSASPTESEPLERKVTSLFKGSNKYTIDKPLYLKFRSLSTVWGCLTLRDSLPTYIYCLNAWKMVILVFFSVGINF